MYEFKLYCYLKIHYVYFPNSPGKKLETIAVITEKGQPRTKVLLDATRIFINVYAI